MSDVVKLYALDKDDLICLVKGSVPHYDLFDHPLIEGNGVFRGQYDSWEWNESKLRKIDTHELSMIHILCKQSWKKSKGVN